MKKIKDTVTKRKEREIGSYLSPTRDLVTGMYPDQSKFG